MKDQQEANMAGSTPLGKAPVENVATPAKSDEARDLRFERIMEYLEGSLHKQDALQANLSAANADLMMIGYKLATAIEAAMATGPASLEAYEDLMPAINNLLRIHKQVDRFSALDNRLAAVKASVAAVKAQAAVVVAQSEDLKI